ncbi:hypothetical protein QTO34_016984 [Cnephaeus nilssonii]|uniref:riboflavin kinase n=1 Tax=Cnephaeus nilssonii TaxID=3371016 RepID=A0AA40LQT9_CNENI|nr:hypothetical protein QTO34_016984 [Eptesicus nilssonii]
MKNLPYFCRCEVMRGFGHGSKQLSIPTANFPEQVVDNLPSDVSIGIYYGLEARYMKFMHRGPDCPHLPSLAGLVPPNCPPLLA